MALINEQYMRDTFQMHEKVVSGRITPYIAVASRRLKKWVGEEAYQNADLFEILKLAEATLVMHFMQLNLNTNIRLKGLVKTEQVEGNVTVQYFSPNETAQYAQQYLDQAEEIVRDLIGYQPEDGFEVIADTERVISKDTWV